MQHCRSALSYHAHLAITQFWNLLVIRFNLMYDSLCHLRWYQSAIFWHLAHGLFLLIVVDRLIAENCFQMITESLSSFSAIRRSRAIIWKLRAIIALFVKAEQNKRMKNLKKQCQQRETHDFFIWSPSSRNYASCYSCPGRRPHESRSVVQSIMVVEIVYAN